MSRHEVITGEELLGVCLGPYQIDFDFTNTLLQVGSKFRLESPTGDRTLFDPEQRVGAVERLWTLIGQRATRVLWQADAEIVIAFESGGSIEIERGYPRGTISDKAHPNRVEDF